MTNDTKTNAGSQTDSAASALEAVAKSIYGDLGIRYPALSPTLNSFVFAYVRASLPKRPTGPNTWADLTLEEMKEARDRISRDTEDNWGRTVSVGV